MNNGPTASSRRVAEAIGCPPERTQLVEQIRREATMLPYPLDGLTISAPVLEAIGSTPREAFMPASSQHRAYIDAPASIGYGQTISQPFIVALMTELLKLKSGDTVLEVGTGSGYQAAILAKLARQVYSVEVIEPLADAARERFRAMHYDNVQVRSGDGALGWSEHAPYDAVIVTAASSSVPAPLIEQMRAGARMVIPIGAMCEPQWLTLLTKGAGGSAHAQRLLPVSFVPLTSDRRTS